MLANAYLPAITAIFGAGASLLLAIVLELPILLFFWPQPKRLAAWVLLANLVSAAAGMVPVLHNTGPGMTVDPWEVHQHWLRTYFLHVGLLFVVTLISEGAVYALLNRRTAARITWSRLLAGLLVSNLASYAVLAGVMLYGIRPDHSVQLLPDTAWLKSCDERVWFVEPLSHHLCSIRLDGSDRRIETAEPLARFDTGFYCVSPYAILPDRQSVLFVAPDLQWRVVEAGKTRSLDIKVPTPDRGGNICTQVETSFTAALKRFSETQKIDKAQIWSNINSMTAHPVVMSDQTGAYKATTVIAGGGESGFGLHVEGPDTKLTFKIPAGPAYLVCTEPALLPERKLVVFRCSAWIMVMDIESRRVGRLVQGDSFIMMAAAFRPDAE